MAIPQPAQGYHLELTLRRDEAPPSDAEAYHEASIYYAHAEMRRYRYDGFAPDGLCQQVPVQFTHEKLLAVSTDIDAYGQLLSEQLFTGGLRDAWSTVRGYARSASEPLRCRLRLEDERLQGLRWELLRDPISARYLALMPDVHLARQLEARDQGQWAKPDPSRLRALVAIANPTNLDEFGLEPINVQEETERALHVFRNIPVECLGGTAALRTTPEALERNLHRGFEIVYLVCHGVMSADGVSSVFLEDASRSVTIVSGRTIYEIFQDLDRPPALVVLAVCQSGGTSDGVTSVTNSLGALLANAGVPAVIAMQGLASFAMVANFIPELFTNLHLDGDIEHALASARRVLRRQDTWWQPVLFTRLLDGQLWKPLGEQGKEDRPSLQALIEDQQVAPAVRVEAAERLALLGDPRPGVVTFPLAWCDSIDAGVYPIGSGTTVRLERFWMARYPVTIGQFRDFIKADGYDDTSWWTENGRRWLDGPPKRVREPYNWGYSGTHDSHPVTGVSWYEAQAFCRWLTSQARAEGWLQDGFTLRLPCAAKWLIAAAWSSADQTLLAWNPPVGAHWAADTDALPGRELPPPVGCFSHMHSPCGALDMAGGVAEWTATLFEVGPDSLATPLLNLDYNRDGMPDLIVCGVIPN